MKNRQRELCRNVSGYALAVALGCVPATPQVRPPEPTPLAPARRTFQLPKACPPGSQEAMEKLGITSVYSLGGELHPPGTWAEEEGRWDFRREGEASLWLDKKVLPNGTEIKGVFYHQDARIHARLTRLKTLDKQEYPVCMVLLDVQDTLGVEVDGRRGEYYKLWHAVRVTPVRSFE